MPSLQIYLLLLYSVFYIPFHKSYKELSYIEMIFQGSFSVHQIFKISYQMQTHLVVSDHHWDLSSGPQDGSWGSWGQLSSCSTTCDEGTQTRTRTCDYPNPECKGAPCPGCQGERCSEEIDSDSSTRCNYETEQKCRFSLDRDR